MNSTTSKYLQGKKGRLIRIESLEGDILTLGLFLEPNAWKDQHEINAAIQMVIDDHIIGWQGKLWNFIGYPYGMRVFE